jgi:hypothetical protein
MSIISQTKSASSHGLAVTVPVGIGHAPTFLDLHHEEHCRFTVDIVSFGPFLDVPGSRKKHLHDSFDTLQGEWVGV